MLAFPKENFKRSQSIDAVFTLCRIFNPLRHGR